jgi:hypothetical protein
MASKNVSGVEQAYIDSAGALMAIAHLLILGGIGICPDWASLRKFDSGISG